jgi:hypothetical protein
MEVVDTCGRSLRKIELFEDDNRHARVGSARIRSRWRPAR